MKLYRILVRHHSQADAHESIEGYFCADNDEEVYDFLNHKGMLKLQLGVSTQKRKENTLECKGDIENMPLFDQLNDFYYGHTLYGWECVGLISIDEMEVLEKFNIIIE